MFNHLFYDITFLPTALGAQWVVVWLSHVFLQVLRLLSHKLLARAAAYTQFRLFVSVLTSAPLPRLPPFLH